MGKPLQEADVLRIIKRDGRYQINPFAWRNAGKMKVLDSMYKRGIVDRRAWKPDLVDYTLPKAAAHARLPDYELLPEQ